MDRVTTLSSDSSLTLRRELYITSSDWTNSFYGISVDYTGGTPVIFILSTAF
jgi:hypothetical protein